MYVMVSIRIPRTRTNSARPYAWLCHLAFIAQVYRGERPPPLLLHYGQQHPESVDFERCRSRPPDGLPSG